MDYLDFLNILVSSFFCRWWAVWCVTICIFWWWHKPRGWAWWSWWRRWNSTEWCCIWGGWKEFSAFEWEGRGPIIFFLLFLGHLICNDNVFSAIFRNILVFVQVEALDAISQLDCPLEISDISSSYTVSFNFWCIIVKKNMVAGHHCLKSLFVLI